MNKSRLKRFGLKFSLLAVAAASLLSAQVAEAQYFNYSATNSDLMLGFRKTGSFAESSELVVDLGSVVNLLKLSVGTTITITNVGRLQLTNMCPDDLANLQWSAFSAFPTAGGITGTGWKTSLGTFPNTTCWYTLPRTDFSTQSTPYPRASASTQGDLRGEMTGVGIGGNAISPTLGATNQFNNSILVTEPVADFQDHTLSYYIEDNNDPSIGDFVGQTSIAPLYPGINYENTTPDPFNSPQRSDFYQSVPSGKTDPLTGQTNGNTYFVGYFTLNTDGSMTFTRDTSSSGGSNPPPAPVLSIISSVNNGGGGGNGQVTSMISFSTTNGVTYSLRYTNAAGLSTPVTNWPVAVGTISGDGLMHSFTNSSTDPNRFYDVTAQ